MTLSHGTLGGALALGALFFAAPSADAQHVVGGGPAYGHYHRGYYAPGALVVVRPAPVVVVPTYGYGYGYGYPGYYRPAYGSSFGYSNYGGFGYGNFTYARPGFGISIGRVFP